MADVRSQLGSALEGKLTPEQLQFLMDEVLAITKRGQAEFACKSCGQRQRQLAEIPDAAAVTMALVKLADQAWGRPNEAERQPEGITFVRKVIYAGAEDSA